MCRGVRQRANYGSGDLARPQQAEPTPKRTAAWRKTTRRRASVRAQAVPQVAKGSDVR